MNVHVYYIENTQALPENPYMYNKSVQIAKYGY